MDSETERNEQIDKQTIGERELEPKFLPHLDLEGRMWLRSRASTWITNQAHVTFDYGFSHLVTITDVVEVKIEIDDHLLARVISVVDCDESRLTTPFKNSRVTKAKNYSW